MHGVKLKKVEFKYLPAVISRLFFLLFMTSYVICCEFAEYHIVDTSRQELYPHDPAHPYREFMMHVWAPSSQQKPHPLILFSHGLAYNGMMYSSLCQTIASRGYVVASISHTYGCRSVQFPDGRQIPYNFPCKSVHFQQGKHIFDIETEIWFGDQVCALNRCICYNVCEGDFLYNRIDESCVGVIGHSMGGCTAIQMCRRDSRVLTAVNLDAPLYGENAMMPFNKPMMFIFGSSVVPHMNTSIGKVPMHYQFIWRKVFNEAWLAKLNLFIASCMSDVYKITLEGIVHATFSDLAYTPDPVTQPWLIDGAQAQRMISEHVCDFFDRYLMHS